MKKIVCQLVVKDVVTPYVIDVEGRLYSTNGVRDGFDFRPVNGQVQRSGGITYPVKRMKLECVLDAGLSKTANVHQTVFSKLFNKNVAIEAEVDDFIYAPCRSTVRVLIVNDMQTTVWIDKNGILYETYKNKHEPIKPAFRDGKAYYPLNVFKDPNVGSLNFVKQCCQGSGLYVEDLIEYYKTVQSHGLPDVTKKELPTQQTANVNVDVVKTFAPSLYAPEKQTWFDKIPNNVEVCAVINDTIELFIDKQELQYWLANKFSTDDTVDVKVFVLSGSVLVSPPEKINNLTF